MQIELLTLHPEFIEILRYAYWNQWEESLKKEYNITDFSEYKLDENGTYYIMFDIIDNKKILIGSIALLDSDLYTHKHIKNWIGYVYVFPEYRMKGVSSQLLQFMCNKYKDLTLTLWCEHHLKDVYEKHNFKII